MSKKAPKAAVPPTQVLPHLWIGSNRNVKDASLMASNGITYILNVAHELDSEPEQEMENHRYMKVIVNEIDILSGKNQFDNLNAMFEFIDEARVNNTKCIVHCLHGRSRSAFVVIAYVMRENRWPLDKAYAYVKGLRASVTPHSKRTLQNFEEHLELNEKKN